MIEFLPIIFNHLFSVMSLYSKHPVAGEALRSLLACCAKYVHFFLLLLLILVVVVLYKNRIIIWKQHCNYFAYFFYCDMCRIHHESKETSSRTSVIARYIQNTFSLVRETGLQGASGEYLYESLARNYLMHLMEKKVSYDNTLMRKSCAFFFLHNDQLFFFLFSFLVSLVRHPLSTMMTFQCVD